MHNPLVSLKHYKTSNKGFIMDGLSETESDGAH